MSCQTKLCNLIADNFISYFKTHVYHFNITGAEFPQYHALFSEVYEYLFDHHDSLSEQLRQMDVKVPGSLEMYLKDTLISPNAKEQRASDMLSATCKLLEVLHETAQKLYEEAGTDVHGLTPVPDASTGSQLTVGGDMGQTYAVFKDAAGKDVLVRVPPVASGSAQASNMSNTASAPSGPTGAQQARFDETMMDFATNQGTTPAVTRVSSGVDANGNPLQNNPNYSDAAGQKANTVWQNMKETGRQLGEGEFLKAGEAAFDIFAPAGEAGFMRTYAPAIAGGLAVTGMMGGYDQKPPPETELQKEMNAKTLAEYKDVRENPGKYAVQNQEGVTYDDRGQVIDTGGAYDYRRVTPEETQVGTRQVLGQGSSAYMPPTGAMTNTQGGIAQPYNMYDMYTNLMPQYYIQQAPRRAAMGGIAELATGGYPRRTGQISGPGTPTSDSIPAMLSDGEFVFTEKAVRGLGGGDRREGAKKMYALMHNLERNAARG